MKSLAEHLGVAPIRQEPEPDDLQFSADMSDADFCRGVLMSRTYRESIQRRIMIDELPPAVERMMWDRAFGRVKHQIEVDDKRLAVDSWDEQQLVEHELALTRHLIQLKKRTNEGITTSDEEDVVPTRVH